MIPFILFSFQSDDEDEDDILKPAGESNKSEETSKRRIGDNPYMRTGTLTHDEYHHYCDRALECTPNLFTGNVVS